MTAYPYGYCGMPCALCSRYRTAGKSRCAGCTADGYYTVPCRVHSCCLEHGAIHCGLCSGFPCERLGKMGDFKDLDTGGIKQRTCALVAEHGFEAWYREYSERADMLTEALARYNNGRMKRYLCELFIKSDIGRLRVIMQRAVEFPSNPKEAGPLFRELAQKFEVQSAVLPVTLDQEEYDAAQTLKNELECGRAAGERDG